MTALETRFWVAYHAIERWHTDTVKAQNFDGPQTSPTKAGSVILFVSQHPEAESWRFRWRTARHDEDRRTLVRELEVERDKVKRHRLEALKVAQKRYWLLDSEQYYGMDYRSAAADLGLEEQTVWQWRKARNLQPRNGKRKKVSRGA